MKKDTVEANPGTSTNLDYLVFSSLHSTFALPADKLVQIVDRPQCTDMPNMPKYVRGAFDFMGTPILLLDIRKIFDNQSLNEELNDLVTTIKLRKQNHLDWINKLKDSVYNDKEITVETNPHNCAFGKWYDAFKTDSTNLNNFLERFDKPHKAIHGLAVQAKRLISKGDKSAAIDLIRNAENKELNFLISLFDTFEETIRTWTFEYAIVINCRDRQVAIAVDDIKYFDKFDEVIPTLPPAMCLSSDHLVTALGRKKIEGRTEDVLIINCDNLQVAHGTTGNQCSKPT